MNSNEKIKKLKKSILIIRIIEMVEFNLIITEILKKLAV